MAKNNLFFKEETTFDPWTETEVDTEDIDGIVIPGAWRETVDLTETQGIIGGRPNFEGKKTKKISL